MGADRVFTNGRGHDKRFGIMHDEGRKGLGGTFDDNLLAFDEVQHVHAAERVVRNSLPEPVSARLDETVCMQAGFFFSPSVAGGNRLKLVDHKSKADRELIAEGDVDVIAEQRLWLVKYQVQGRQLEARLAEA